MSRFFLAIVHMSISASWLVLAVLLLRLVLKKAPKWVSVLLWGFVAVRLICPFSIESVFSLIPSAEAIPQQVFSGMGLDMQTGIPQINVPINNHIGGQSVTGTAAPANPGVDVMTVLAAVWLAGIAVMLIYTAISYLLLRRKVATAVRLQGNIYQSEFAASPFVLGMFRPRIYLPFGMDSVSAQHVISHEQSHIRRKDHWWKPLGFVLLALHWFNPLMWVGYILLCRDIELACDEKVIKEMDSKTKADYTQALVSCSVRRRSIAACPLAFGEVGVKARVKSVLNYRKPAFWIIIVAILLSVVVAVCFLTDPPSNTLKDIEDLNLGTAKQEEVWVSNGQWHTYVGTTPAELVQEVYDLPISQNEISQDRSKDRDKSHTLILCDQNLQKPEMSYLLGTYIHFNQDFTQVWVDIGEKQTLSYRVLQPEQAEALYSRIQGNRSGTELIPKEPIHGNLQTYYKNPDGTWLCDGYNYKYRLEITGQMPNSNAISTFVYLSNLENITFERAWLAAGLSSYSGDYFKPEEANLVEWNTKAGMGTDENGNFQGDVPAVVARDYLSGGVARLLSFGYTVDQQGQMVIACGNGPDEGAYGEENTLVLDGKHGQNKILLVPNDAVLQHYCIYSPDGGIYDDGNGQFIRAVQTEQGVCLTVPIEPGEYIYGLELSWPELGITATYGLKVVMTGKETELDRAIDSIMDAYARENELIEVKLVDQYTLANSVYSSERYLFRVQRASDAAPTWVEVEKSTGKITGEKDDPEKWLVNPPPDVQAGFSTQWSEDYYTMEDFADVVIGQSTMQDAPDPPDNVVYAASYGLVGVYPMENGEYIHVKFYAPDMVVGAIEIKQGDLMQEMVNNPNENLGTFSYAQDYAYYAEDAGTKLSGFVNVKPSDVKTAADAIELAKKECTVEYDSIGVAYDPDSGIYRVSFSKMFVDGDNQSVYILGGDQGVYMDGSGITQMIHHGE